MRAAFYESDITPPLGCYQTGYGFERIAEDVYDKLYSKSKYYDPQMAPMAAKIHDLVKKFAPVIAKNKM